SVRSSSPRAPMYMSNGSFPTSVMLRPSCLVPFLRIPLVVRRARTPCTGWVGLARRSRNELLSHLPSSVGSLQRLVWLQVSHRKNAVPMLGSIPLMIHSWTWSHIWSLIAVVLEMSNQLVDIVEISVVAVT